MNAAERSRIERGVQHVHSLGARATCELLLALTSRVGGGGALAELLEDYGRITPRQVRAAGGDRFARRTPKPVPADLMRGAA